MSEKAREILIKAAELAREAGRTDLEEWWTRLADEGQEDAENGAERDAGVFE